MPQGIDDRSLFLQPRWRKARRILARQPRAGAIVATSPFQDRAGIGQGEAVAIARMRETVSLRSGEHPVSVHPYVARLILGNSGR